jgi:cupin-like protein
MRPAETVAETDRLPQSDGEWQALYEAHRPTVFRGVVAGWNSGQATSDDAVLEWLAAQGGDELVQLTVGLPDLEGYIGVAGVSNGRSRSTAIHGQCEFGRAVAAVAREARTPTGHPVYLASLDVATVLPRLPETIGVGVARWAPQGQWRAWIGSGAHRVGLHTDPEENLHCLLWGRKRFTILPYDVLPQLYVGPLLGGLYGATTSVVDPKAPDHEAYPRFREAMARAIDVEMDAGDVLYLPCHWWHGVESFGCNVAANYWWRDIPPEKRFDSSSLFMRALLELRDLPPHWRAYWKTMFDQFVFRADGDPYGHLPVEAQGVAGAATGQRLSELRARVEADDARRFARGIVGERCPSDPYAPCGNGEGGERDPLVTAFKKHPAPLEVAVSAIVQAAQSKGEEVSQRIATLVRSGAIGPATSSR